MLHRLGRTWRERFVRETFEAQLRDLRPDEPFDVAHITNVLDDTVAMFGAERCLFGSNFPIEKLWTGYRDLVDAYRTAAARLRPEQRDAIFATTAARVYRLGP